MTFTAKEKLSLSYVKTARKIKSHITNNPESKEKTFDMMDALNDVYINMLSSLERLEKMEQREVNNYFKKSVYNRFRRLQREKGFTYTDYDFSLLSDDGHLVGSIDFSMLYNDITEGLAETDKDILLGYIKGKTERELAAESGISHVAIHKRLQTLKNKTKKAFPCLWIDWNIETIPVSTLKGKWRTKKGSHSKVIQITP